jgi:hypothetical protein
MGRVRPHPFMGSRTSAVASYDKIESNPGRRQEGQAPGDLVPREMGMNDHGSPGESVDNSE